MSRLSPEVLAGLTEPEGLCISPDGERVVFSARTLWVRKSEYIQSMLWIADVGRENSARRLTTDDFHNHTPKFSPDGKYISFISDRAKPGAAAGLYLLSLDGGEATPLTDKDNEMGVEVYQWKGDSKAIAYTCPDEKSDERKEREKNKNDAKDYDEDIDFARLRIIDIDTKVAKVLESVKGHVVQIAWNRNCTKLAYATTDRPTLNDLTMANKLCIVDVANDVSESLYTFKAMVLDLCWHSDRLVWQGDLVTEIYTSGRAVMSIPSKEQLVDSHTIISHGETDCVGSIKLCNNMIMVYVLQGLTDIIESLDGTELYRGRAAIKGWDVHMDSSSRATLVIADGKVGVPTEVYSIIAGNRVKLSQLGDHLAEQQIGSSYLLEYTHEDGTPIDGLFAVPTPLLPSFQDHKPQPTVVVVHGGPYSRVSDSFDIFSKFTAFFMSLGYLVLCPNYRGGAGHGQSYAQAVRHDASQSYQDVIWLVRKGIEEKRIDPDRVTIMGWSQGGYMTYLSITRDSTFHFRAAMAGAGVTDWQAMVHTSDLPELESAMSGPKPWEANDINDITSRKCSPIYYIRDVKTPLLIIHGEQDQRTPFEQAVGFYRGMKALGKDVTMVAYPGEGHGAPMPWTKTHYIDMLERMEKFLKKHMA